MAMSRAGVTKRSRALAVGVVLVLLPAVAGCGARTGAVSGKVTFNGRTVSFGIVAFIGPDGGVASSQIESDGSYRIAAAPVGPVKITVQSLPPPPQMVPFGP